MSIALVPGQTASAQNLASAASIAVSFPSAVGAGHLITVKASNDDPQTVSNVVMTGETFQSGVHREDATIAHEIDGWYAYNTAGGQTQVTVNFSAATVGRSIAIAEWSGVQTSPDPKDQSTGAIAAGTSAAAISGADVTTGAAGELIWGAYFGADGGPATANSPYTLLESETTTITGSEYQFQASAGAVHADFNTTSATRWVVVLMSFKAAPPGGPPVSPQSGQWALNLMAVRDWDEVASGQPPGLTGALVRALETFPMLPSTTPAVGGQGVVTAVETQVFVVSDGT